ncbi:MAG: tRNA (adenosine(37)-N6)-threonylcarbamoyltransferase complex ATPase subunit type 1 TsaE [Hyphomicrobium sp.]|uniref:tRNA (adenosine(37)-N6)-threonylcarbamoyltransferase complex ATPase subunit type 1 TsaE n=1 Tax=Hyphomicrobium sp. TaxID=82 RepID=UPI0013274609|nr:tRNA (adenosine(37)-N6)-threonylcarbamoyltransferase complex ATPase subunit type 1 TsaE [Hyphomicrobium sp.]KAB2941845.1 MAG: tRNA (adenosine(37)-N6)-threonylcarbamoyltransferase complex ATPase subunit type 1 TsaE [Hyphomicrobium sp.]MBZ0210589.1 tRNA (adenosine(37)-N6)-threonylcarbamoyltransferase complex ATPase subunit type 1 TsaE [Hyphomicrobium sp.]
MASHVIDRVTEPQLVRLGEDLAFVARRGDLIALSGELGAGKTTLARAIIHALAGNKDEEIPSPTFTLVQTYATPRMPVAHFDLYRLGAPSEIEELGLDLALKNGIAIVEWPEHAGALLPASRLEVRLDDNGEGASRRVTLIGHGDWEARLKRFVAMRSLIGGGGGGGGTNGASCELRYLQGDASVRRYARLLRGPRPGAILMDWPRQPDGPAIRNGLPYSRLAHLAEDVRPFVAVANALHAAGLTVPRIHAQDLDNGFLLLDDLGDRVFGREVETGATDQATLWQAATDALVALQDAPAPQTLPVAGGGEHHVAAYDRGAMAIETELLVDWYWPALRGGVVPRQERAEFVGLWAEVFVELAKMPAAWVLRDYHSPNLLWLPERQGIARVGVIDFQDAMRGPAAYDLVSLLQDARVDVAPELEAALFDHYCAGVTARRTGFDRDAFTFAYAALGAQRNTKIVGIFARLAKRDGKFGYLHHIPRLWRYLDRDLSHPQLAGLKRWYDRHFPADARNIPLA